jgi:signal transduction histidine kinase
MNQPSRRLTIRMRLALLSGGAFFVAGVVLVALMYVYLAQVLEGQMLVQGRITGLAPGDLPPLSEPGDAGPQQVVRFLLRRARDDTLNTMLIASLVGVTLLGLVAGLVGWLLAGQALQPLRQITATARRVADRSLHERIELVGPSDEIKELADTLDAMLERLDRSFDSQQRFIANASHELRTPLTINRTLIEVAMMDPAAGAGVQQLGRSLLAVNQRHERLIDGLLTLAGSEQRPPDLQPVDFAEIAGHVAGESEPVAKKLNVDLRTRLLPAPARGEPFLLERLVQNLLENALKYNLADGGWVLVETRATADVVTLSVENTGPVVPAYEIAGLFEPFRRLRATERIATGAEGPIARGAGLGLSIVRAVARAHGGSVAATPREGGGLVVTVELPSASEVPARTS